MNVLGIIVLLLQVGEPFDVSQTFVKILRLVVCGVLLQKRVEFLNTV